MSTTPWPSEWMRGVRSLVVMRVLATGPTYGYAIIAALEDAGFGTLKGGTLYPLLSRLEVAELVTTQWRAGDGGPERKYFQLTDNGIQQLHEQAQQWQAFVTQTTTFITPEES